MIWTAVVGDFDSIGHHKLGCEFVHLLRLGIPSAPNNVLVQVDVQTRRHKMFSEMVSLFLEAAEERSGLTCPETFHVLKAGVS